MKYYYNVSLGGNVKEYYCYGNAKKLISLPASHYEVKWKILPIFFFIRVSK